MKKTPRFTFGIILVLLVLTSVTFVSAYKQLCLNYGQTVPSDLNARYTCYHDVCQICVTDNNYPTAPYRCNKIEGCELFGNSTVDAEPPELTINSPVNGEVYDSRKVLFDLESNEPSSFYYIDNINGRGRWSRLSSNTQNYFRSLSFKEGLNNITIESQDRNNNAVQIVREFYVDSKKPKITRTYPKKGFADGNFEVQFSEENPENLTLYYGLGGVIEKQTAELNIKDCDYIKKKYYCYVEVDLSDFNNQDIEYWFELKDMANSVDKSKPIKLSVDTTPPDLINDNVLPNQLDSFWKHSEEAGRDSKYVYFEFNINEPNFDEVVYVYEDSRGREREKKLCSRLKEGKCVKKISFRKGYYNLDVIIRDEAGNSVGYPIEFYVDY